jgi:hypothetical protein
MAVVEEIRIEGDTSGFQKQIDALNKKIEELEKSLGGVQKEAADVGKEAKKTGNAITKAFGGLKKVVTAPFDLAKKAAGGLGTLLKGGLGFGLITAAVDKLSESFNSNQKVVDAVNKVLATLSIIFNQISEAIFGAVEEQSKLNGGFDATKKVLGGLISGVLNVFVGIIQGIKLAVQEVQLAWEQSFFGDKDANRIKELNEQIAVTRQELSQTGEQLLESGKMVVENLAEAAGEVANTVVAVAQSATKAIQNLDVAKATAQAERLIELQKQAALADVARQKIQLEFQNTQEQLRQLRDDEQKSLEERQKANDQLLESFQEQARLEREQLNIKVAAAAAEYEINKTNENLIALKQAQLELTDLDERLQGQKSEALSNQNSLLREQEGISKSISEATIDAFEVESRAGIELERNNVLRIRKEIALAEELYRRKEALLKAEIAKYKEGTAQRAEAENALLALQKENAATLSGLTKSLQDESRAQFLALVAEISQTIQQTLDTISGFYQAANNKERASIESRMKSLEEAGKSETKAYSLLIKERDALAEKEFKIQKRLSVAGAIVKGIEAVLNAYATAQGSPITLALPAYPFVQAGLAAAFAASQVAAISSQSFQSSGSSSPSISGAAPSTPSQPAQFNIIGQSGTNQLAQSIGGQFDQPIRAYVVGQDVTTSQQLQRQRVRTATFG